MELPSRTVIFGLGLLALTVATSGCETTKRAWNNVTSAVMTASSNDPTSFAAVDADHNGYIDERELSQIGPIDIGSSDINGDGRLTRGEFEAAMVRQSSP